MNDIGRTQPRPFSIPLFCLPGDAVRWGNDREGTVIRAGTRKGEPVWWVRYRPRGVRPTTVCVSLRDGLRKIDQARSKDDAGK